MQSKIKKRLFVKPTLLSFYMGRIFGQDPYGIVQIVLHDGRVFTQFVQLDVP